MWLLRNTATQGNPDNSFNYGWAGAQPVLGRWTQDGPVGVATYSPPGAQFNNTTSSLWSLRNSASAGTPDSSFYYGTTGDVPLAGDWDGNLQTGIGVFRPSNQNWILRNAPSGGAADIPIFAYGAPGDIPVVGDWDMDGKATIGIARPPFSQFNSDSRYLWLLRNTNSNGSNDIPAFYFGFGGDIPVVGDWDQDGRTTIGVFRPAGTGTNTTTSGQWLLTNIFSSTPTINFYYGASGDVPAVGAVQYIPCL